MSVTGARLSLLRACPVWTGSCNTMKSRRWRWEIYFKNRESRDLSVVAVCYKWIYAAHWSWLERKTNPAVSGPAVFYVLDTRWSNLERGKSLTYGASAAPRMVLTSYCYSICAASSEANATAKSKPGSGDDDESEGSRDKSEERRNGGASERSFLRMCVLVFAAGSSWVFSKSTRGVKSKNW